MPPPLLTSLSTLGAVLAQVTSREPLRWQLSAFGSYFTVLARAPRSAQLSGREYYPHLTPTLSTPYSLYSLLTTHYSLPTTHHSLLSTLYSLLSTHYFLFIIHCSFLTTHYSLLSLLTTHYPLLTT